MGRGPLQLRHGARGLSRLLRAAGVRQQSARAFCSQELSVPTLNRAPSQQISTRIDRAAHPVTERLPATERALGGSFGGQKGLIQFPGGNAPRSLQGELPRAWASASIDPSSGWNPHRTAGPVAGLALLDRRRTSAIEVSSQLRPWLPLNDAAVDSPLARAFSTGSSSPVVKPKFDGAGVFPRALDLVRAPQRSVAAAVASAGAQLTTFRKFVLGLRTIRSIVKAWNYFTNLPPVSHSIHQARQAVARRQEALGLQLQAFWRTNTTLMVGASGAVAILALDRTLLFLTQLFVAPPLSFATHFNYLAISSAAVVGTGLYFRSRTSLSVDTVRSKALNLLNAHPGVLEVLGAPIAAGTTDHGIARHAIAAALLGGGVKFRFGLKESPVLLAVDLPARTCISVFAVKGSEAMGIINVAATKHHGRYSINLLAVDVQIPPQPSSSAAPSEPEQQRVFVVGSPAEHEPLAELLQSLKGSFQAASVGEKQLLSKS